MVATEIKVGRIVDVDVCCSFYLLFHNLPATCCLEGRDARNYTTNAVPGHTVRMSTLPVTFSLRQVVVEKWINPD